MTYYSCVGLFAEPMCNRTWDGWLCWDDTKAGVIVEQHCPDYFHDFDPSGETTIKKCSHRSLKLLKIIGSWLFFIPATDKRTTH